VASRQLDPALAQQYLSEVLAPDEVVACSRAHLADAPRLGGLEKWLVPAIVAALLALSFLEGIPLWPGIPLLLGSHVPQLLRRQSPSRWEYLLAITRSHLILTDYPAAAIRVRVVFAGPADALRLDTRRRGRITTVRCTAADGAKLVLYGRRRRAVVLAIPADDPAPGVLEAFQARGGAVGPTGTRAVVRG